VKDTGVAEAIVFNMLWMFPPPQNDGYLATFFNFEISGLADRFLMEMKENVNPIVFDTPATH
jgi:hypothetical protein